MLKRCACPVPILLAVSWNPQPSKGKFWRRTSAGESSTRRRGRSLRATSKRWTTVSPAQDRQPAARRSLIVPALHPSNLQSKTRGAARAWSSGESSTTTACIPPTSTTAAPTEPAGGPRIVFLPSFLPRQPPHTHTHKPYTRNVPGGAISNCFSRIGVAETSFGQFASG